MARIAILLLWACGLWAQRDDPLKGLRRNHPRLILLDQDLERLRRLIRDDPRAGAIYGRLAADARKLVSTPPVEYRPAGGRIQHLSRACVQRLYTLGLLFRLDGNREYLERGIRELRAVASFPDWNANFLDKAEMTHAVAIGYDWFFNSLSPADRLAFRSAIVEKGVRDAIPIYQEKRWWAINVLNWNPVCNGGVGLGALAVADEEPELARMILRYVLQSFPLALSSYAPDGAWVEGPEYWHYATRYAVCLLAGMKTALGHDFGLSRAAGMAVTGRFRVHATAPSGKLFNYADGWEEIEGAPEMFWLANRFHDPVCAWHQSRLIDSSGRSEPLDLVWYSREAADPLKAGWPPSVRFRRAEVAVLRSSWSAPDAIYVGVKGGTNRGGRGHAHLDLGSFVLEARGIRWAIDLGRNDYDVPEYFGNLRWTYYRTKTESHNTVLIDSRDQDIFAEAPIAGYRFGSRLSFVRLDLSKTYPGRLTRFERGVALAGGRYVVVQDEIEARQPVDALWGMVTGAAVDVHGNQAELRKDKWALSARVIVPAGARFDVVSTQVPPPQTQNGDTRKLVVRLPGKISNLRLVIALMPHRDGDASPPPDWVDRSLRRW